MAAKRAGLVLVAGLLVGACGACSAAGDGPVYSDSTAPSLTVDTRLTAAEPEPCGVAFDPAPELAEATGRAAERWSAATGCDVRVEAGGVPVQLASVEERDGHRAAAVRDHATGAWFIGTEPGLLQWTAETLLAHEIGHVLGCLEHTDDDLMAAPTTLRAPIDADALACVCERLDCAAFNPER